MEILFVPSAFKHDITRENIRWVLLNHLADGLIEEGNSAKYLSIGFDRSGNLLEIMYNYLDARTVRVFHAMKCRKQFYEALNYLGGNDG